MCAVHEDSVWLCPISGLAAAEKQNKWGTCLCSFSQCSTLRRHTGAPHVKVHPACGPTFAMKIVSNLKKSFHAPSLGPRFAFEKMNYPIVRSKIKVVVEVWLISSVRSSSVYHGLLHTRKQPTFSDSKVKVKVKGPNMCYIFEKHGIQGYRIWHSRVSNVK